MRIPGFTAEASFAGNARSYERKTAAGSRTARAARIVPAFAGSATTRGRGAAVSNLMLGTAVGFACGGNSCRCHGVDDCVNLLVTTDLCGTYITCDFPEGGEPSCYCVRKDPFVPGGL